MIPTVLTAHHGNVTRHSPGCQHPAGQSRNKIAITAENCMTSSQTNIEKIKVVKIKVVSTPTDILC